MTDHEKTIAATTHLTLAYERQFELLEQVKELRASDAAGEQALRDIQQTLLRSLVDLGKFAEMQTDTILTMAMGQMAAKHNMRGVISTTRQ